MTNDNTPVAAPNGSRPYGEVLADAIGLLTEVARHTDGGFTAAPSGGRAPDFAEFLMLAVAGAAANVGGVELLLAGRPGSWEADYVRNMLHSTVGSDEDHLFEHRTEPFVVTVHVDEILFEVGYADLFDKAEAELVLREQVIDEAIGDNESTPEQTDELDAIAELWGKVEELRRADWAAYGDAFREQVLAVVAEQYPDLTVPVEVVVHLDGNSDTYDGEFWAPVDQVRSIARSRTPLPSSGIALADYPSGEDLAAIEREAGRDPLTRLDVTH